MSEYFALLDNNYHDDGESWLFTDPLEWITCHSLNDAENCLKRIEQSEHYAVGFISYEFAKHFGYAAKTLSDANEPYLQFGIFRHRTKLSTPQVDQFLRERFQYGAPFICDVQPTTTREAYDQAIHEIKSELEAGNTYQVNYTFETRFNQGGCPYRLYDILRQAQPVPYGAFLNFPTGQTLSRSPELFFKKQGAQITCKPMKGTEPRSKDLTQDQVYRSHLVASPKQRAENLMIVDLLRNDLSRIAELGTVQVEKLYEVETYQTVHQMTSTITAQVIDKNFTDILEALFPCGSITGAPKYITTQIIDRLEPHSRGIYCGAIGMIDPKGDMVFNVPIRTLLLDDHQGRFHIGGGVVYDSLDTKEYDEALLKGKFLFELPKDFSLLDSHFYSPETGARNLDLHMSRLAKSARALSFPFDETTLQNELNKLYAATNFDAKIRIEIAQSGAVMVEAIPLDEFEGEKFITLSPHRTQPNDPIWQHKTTNRGLYNSEFKAARKQGVYDVIFANDRGELTEGAIHNLVLRMDGQLLTPPLSSGCLAGIGRQIALENEEIQEQILPLQALEKADEIYLISSVRGLVKVQYQPL